VRTVWSVVAAAVISASVAHADDLGGLSLEELLELELDVAAKAGRTIRESPGVLTLVTREEILSSGARDLTDLLLRVPGISFGVDVAGIQGIGFRGIWAHEGKVLLLLDGMEMNENLYSSTQWGHHLPADQVERIEIIRGPGSSIYGGYAELMVLNVITRSAADLQGGQAHLTYGQRDRDLGRRGASLSYGREAGGVAFEILGAFEEGTRSSSPYTDFYGTTYEMSDNSDLIGSFAKVGARWKGLSFQYLWDDYRMTVRDSFGESLSGPVAQTFVTHIAELKYEANIGDTITVTPKATARRQVPWRTAEKSSGQFYDKSVDRYGAGVSADWRAAAGVSLLAGAEAFHDRAFLNDTELVGLQTNFQNGESSIAYDNVAGFAQALWDTRVANLAVGARFENHSEFGSSFVPRAAIARVMDRFHVKALYSAAFRVPGVENLRLNEDIEPERTTVIEAEAGYKVTDILFVTANVFDITLRSPIVYFYSDEEGEAYLNYDRTGSRGIETELKIQDGRRRAYLGLSIYDATGKNEVDVYEVPDHPGALLGMPQLKIVAGGAAPLSENVTFDVSAVLLGPRHGYLEGDGAGGSLPQEENPVMLLNTFVWARGLGLERLDLGIGVYNLLDQDYRLLQPYAGGHAPLPVDEREVVARASYAF